MDTYQTTDQKLLFETGDGTSGVTAATGSGAVTFGQWHQVAAVVDQASGTANLYVDGSNCAANVAIQAGFTTQGDLNLGRFTNNALYFKGGLDEARIEVGARSANWIWANWMTAASNATWTSYSPVVRQTPSLLLSTVAGSPVLSWPAAGLAFALYAATNLTPPVLWTRVTNAPSLTATQWEVHLPKDAANPQFYRLQSP